MNGFPLRMIFRDPSGAVDIRIEAVRIEKKPIADSEFTIPRGYKRSF